ncbi:MAG: PKD domain-containing protein, partial [Candidatus Woesearchaeota archaeon]
MKFISKKRVAALTLFALFVVFIPLASSAPANSITVNGYFKEDGEYVKVASNTCKDSGSCSLNNFNESNYCEYEGDYYIKAIADGVTGEVSKGPKHVYTVNYDDSRDSCLCDSEDNEWDTNFGQGTNGKCCGDDPGENYIEGLDGTDACCNDSANTVFDGECHKTNATGAFFENLGGEIVDEIQLNDTVKLIVGGEWMEGRTINYTIKKEGGDGWLGWLSPDEVVSEEQSSTFITKKFDESGNYKFIAEVEEGGTVESDVLSVSDEEDNNPPHVEIVNPENKQVYEVNEEIEFKQNSYDVDDEIETEWDFGDGETNNTYNTTYSYDSTGQKTVTLMAEDERGKTREESVDILVIDPEVNEKNIFAYIDKPSGIIGEKVVRIDATSTYAIETEDGDIKCIGGDCPKETQKGEDIESSTGPKYKDITFDWGFIREDEEEDKKSRGGRDGALFIQILSEPGDYKAKLNASINPSSQTESEFSLNFDEPTCVEDGRSWYEGGQYKSSLDDCYKEDSEGSSIKCCPQGYECEVEDGEGECVRMDDPVTNYCSDYDTEEDCEDYGQTVAINSVEDVKEGGYCTDPYMNETDEKFLFVDNCRCEWDGECKSKWDWDSIDKDELWNEDDKVEGGEDMDGNDTTGKEGSCSSKVEEVISCEEGEGMKKIKWESEWEGEGSEGDCQGSGTKRVPCLSGGLLSFFSVGTVILVIILII